MTETPVALELNSFPISRIPPAGDHNHQLSVVTDDDGKLVCLALSNGGQWHVVTLVGPLADPDPTPFPSRNTPAPL